MDFTPLSMNPWNEHSAKVSCWLSIIFVFASYEVIDSTAVFHCAHFQKEQTT